MLEENLKAYMIQLTIVFSYETYTIKS